MRYRKFLKIKTRAYIHSKGFLWDCILGAYFRKDFNCACISILYDEKLQV